MDKIYHILLIEDLPSDAFLIKREIKKILNYCIFECVETKKDFTRSLNEFKPDIILSDFSIPGFDWLTAFNLTRKQSPLVPFIIVTGSANPDIAAECIKTGVNACITKLQIEKLGPVILNVLSLSKEDMKQE